MDSWASQRRQAAIEHLMSAGWLKQVDWLEEIDSTNSQSRRWLIEGQLPTPALLVADQQTAGRGRAARSWWSPAGCLMLSVVIDSQWMPTDTLTWPQLSLVTGVAAALAVEHEVPGTSIQLKWPNDLYLADRKLAGILVEAVPLSKSDALTHADQQPGNSVSGFAFVIGIGINVSVDFRSAPSEVRERACSLSQFSTVALTLESILVRLMEQLEMQLTKWRAGQSDWWRDWSERSLLTGRAVLLQLPVGRELVGRCEGIDPSGYLLVRDTHQIHRVQSADIVRWE